MIKWKSKDSQCDYAFDDGIIQYKSLPFWEWLNAAEVVTPALWSSEHGCRLSVFSRSMVWSGYLIKVISNQESHSLPLVATNTSHWPSLAPRYHLFSYSCDISYSTRSSPVFIFNIRLNFSATVDNLIEHSVFIHSLTSYLFQFQPKPFNQRDKWILFLTTTFTD